MGIHISEESENKHSVKEIWESTISTFLSKFILTLTFIIPLFVFELSKAVSVAVVWGVSLLAVFSFIIARKQKKKAWKVIGEHLLITSIVILATHYLGHFCQNFLG
jgi:VIT1/CCC1 family predicted Fe2+/Mn2+ transporter